MKHKVKCFVPVSNAPPKTCGRVITFAWDNKLKVWSGRCNQHGVLNVHNGAVLNGAAVTGGNV